MKKSQMVLRGGCALSAVVLAGALFTAPAMAQDTNAVPASAPSAEGPQDIVVTGSRIPQPNLESVSPVTVVNSQDLKLQGVTRVEDMLNSLPQVFAGQSSTVSNGASGAATVDLRGLGPQRTLVLINGRRLMPGDPTTSAADLNSIPDALVKRVEVLTGGASSTYGADAVAGVVNFIMDTEFTGVRLDGQYSLFQHNNNNSITPPLLDARTKAGFSGFGYPDGSVTDGGTVNTTLSVGAKFDDGRGHAVAYFGYRKVDAVLQSNRDYSACTIQNANATALQCGGSSTSAPGNIVLYNDGTSTFFQIGSGRTLQPGRTRYNFAPTNYYQRPDERYTGGAFVNYEVSDALHPYLEFNFMDDRSVAQIAPSGDFGNTLTVNCDNPLMSAQQKSIVCANENLVNGFLGNFPLTAVTNPGPGAINYIDPTTGQPYNKAFFQLLRRNVEGGPRAADFGHTQYRGVIGAKGALGETWNYDAYYQYGRTTYSQIYTNEFSVRKLNNALDVVNVNGKPTCRSVTTGADPNCVPYDIFGGLSTVTQAAVNYLSATGFQHGIVSEQVASGSITGDLGNYGIKTPWADKGAVINLGVEYRREALDLKVDEGFATGDLTGQGGATLPISGNYRVTEGFGEAQVPLVNKNFVYDLSFVGGYRYSHYEISNGRSFNTNTYKLGLEFAPVRSVRFRGSYNRAVRAPNLQELFSVQHVALDGSTDPCSDRVLTAADKGCLAQGLSIGQRVASNPAGQYNGLIGGNDQLTPEIATTKSFGVVFQPDFIPGLNLSVDYFDIKVRGAIQGFGADAILASCTNTLNPKACALINRNPVTGSLWLTNDGYVNDISSNVGRVQTKGIDVNFGYTRKIDSVGDFSLTMIGTYLDSYEINNGLTDPYDCAGYYGTKCSTLTSTPSAPNPRWRHKARLSYTSSIGIGASLQWRYIDPVKVDLSSTDKTLQGNYFAFGSRLAAQNYFDLALTFAPTKKYTLRLGVNNMFDREPPLVGSGDASGNASACPTGPCNGNTYPAVYDALGRYIFAGATINF
jgi:iron complex outermembrane recepter protein